MSARSLVGVVAIGLVTACGGSSGYTTSSNGNNSGNGAGPGANEVWMQNLAFNPATLNVTAGATVTWTNKDGVTHTVTYSSGPDSAFSASVPAGATFQHTFSTAGTYQYYCQIHGTPTTGMRGSVVAQ